jgi:dolichyl-phosphate-mannose--protein O-mannosyl transferase
VTLTRGPAESLRPLGSTPHGDPLPRLSTRFTSAVAGSSRWAGWLGPLVVAALALGLRLWQLGRPEQLTFDETYYAKDAWSLSRYGFVQETTDAADDRINAGELDARIFTGGPAQIVHPEVGKWMLAVGIRLFGMDPFGWRVAAAVTGALTVLVLCRLVRRLSGSTLVGCLAGLLLCFDGLHLVMSRTALIDVFVAFWLVCAVACLVADRDWGRRRLLRLVDPDGLGPAGGIGAWGPVRPLLWRPWRIAAGVCFGLACGSKWNGVFVLAAFGLLVWAWDAGARRAIGVSAAWARSLVVDAVPAFLSLVGVALVVYVGTWTGWLVHHDEMQEAYAEAYSWGDYATEEPESWAGETQQAVRDLWNYHQQMWDFHTVSVVETTRDDPHPYESDPRGWLLTSRPVGIDLQGDIAPGDQGCTAPRGETCLRQVLALGNPAVWWLGAAALLASVWQWLARRDWRFGVPVVAVSASWLPWFRWDDRSIFFFYAVTMIPFTCAALALMLGAALGPPTARASRRRAGAAAVGVVLFAVVVCFAFFWPIWTDQLIPNSQWQRRMWFDRWT